MQLARAAFKLTPQNFIKAHQSWPALKVFPFIVHACMMELWTRPINAHSYVQALFPSLSQHSIVLLFRDAIHIFPNPNLSFTESFSIQQKAGDVLKPWIIISWKFQLSLRGKEKHQKLMSWAGLDDRHECFAKKKFLSVSLPLRRKSKLNWWSNDECSRDGYELF